MAYLPSLRLDGQTAMVTGASQGLGRHIALALAEAGADLVLVARQADALAAVAAEAESLGRRAVFVPADLSRVDEIQRAVQAARSRCDAINILVNNAGTNVQQMAVDVTEAAWDQVMNINLKGTFFTAQAVGRLMIEQGKGGRIINIASQYGEVGFYKRAAYCSSKGGMVQLTRVLAIEWAPYGIRVNAVGPTWTDSPLARRLIEDDVMASEVPKRIPIGRMGRPEEVAAAVLYLASEGADLVTGHHLLVDGGWTAW